MRYLNIVAIVLLALPLSVVAAETKTTTPQKIELKNEQSKQSYSLGLNIGAQAQKSFKAQQITIDSVPFIRGIQDALTDATPLLNEDEVVSSLRNLQKQIIKNQEQQVADKAKGFRNELFALNSFPMIGNKKGDVTIVEFFDYRCPHCQRVADRLPALVKKDKKLRVVFRDFPILGPMSTMAARAAMAAKAQNKYMEFHQKLMNTRFINKDKLLELAKDLKLNTQKFTEIMEGKNTNAIEVLEKNRTMARQIGLSYTPGFFIAPTPTGKEKIDAKAPLYFVTGEPTEAELKAYIEKARKNS